MMKKGCCTCGRIAKWLTIIGAVNWGLVGVGMIFSANWNVVNLIFGGWMWLEAVIYILVGLSGLVLLFGCKCKKCKGGKMDKMEQGSEMPQGQGGQQM